MVAFFCPPPFMRLTLTSTFVGITSLIQTSGVISWPSGTQTGDLAIAIGVGNSSVSPSGWTTVAGDPVNNAPSVSSFAFKVLAAADITSPPSIAVPTNGAFYVAIYRGGTVVTKKATNASTTASVVVPGFVKSVSSRRVLAVGHDRDPGISAVPPSGFTLRASDSSTYFMNALYDVSASSYTDGSSVTFNLVAGSFGGRGTLLEVT